MRQLQIPRMNYFTARKALQPAELLSTASYKPSEMIEYQPDQKKPVRMAEVVAVSAEGIRIKGQRVLVAFDKVAAAYSKRRWSAAKARRCFLHRKSRRTAKSTRTARGKQLQ
jgi:hypothetical protein